MTDKLVDRREPGFYIVDNEIIEVFGAKLGVYGIAVYNVLLKFANANGENAFPSYQTIADLLNMSRPKAVDAVKLLLECGLIEKTPRKSASGDPTTNIYTLLDVKKVAGGSKQDLLGGSKQDLLGGKPRLPDQDPLIKTPSDQDPPKERETLPEKTEAEKPPKPSSHPAVKAYREIRKRYPGEFQMEMIVKADPDLPTWIKAVTTWIGRGHNPGNIEGMLEWAANPSLMERFSGNGTQKKDTIRNRTEETNGQVASSNGLSDEEIERIRSQRRERKAATQQQQST